MQLRNEIYFVTYNEQRQYLPAAACRESTRAGPTKQESRLLDDPAVWLTSFAPGSTPDPRFLPSFPLVFNSGLFSNTLLVVVVSSSFAGVLLVLSQLIKLPSVRKEGRLHAKHTRYYY